MEKKRDSSGVNDTRIQRASEKENSGKRIKKQKRGECKRASSKRGRGSEKKTEVLAEKRRTKTKDQPSAGGGLVP